MHFLYYILAFAIFIALAFIISWSHEWIKGNYQNLNEWVRWIIFLPISTARAGIISVALLINTLYLFPLKEGIAQCINWIVVPIFFFYTVSLTIPRGKKLIPIILCSTWMTLGVLSIFNNDPHAVIRVIQTCSLAYFLYLWAKIPAKDLYK